ncbi:MULTISPECIES: 4-hydroxy-tetrahydrodipicolinate synthase [Shouchella]|uniref:4-hydroxy-tetrahydrodipicolinate synthase n=2 Tax=Shouchella clausii TaxID=79880 RepID=A0A268P571_SHOCL|nr:MULTISPECIES: 4-hydroxy-tetrahydrodipicolinate synthase [Shouchella]MDO7268159.1 4-hydroxy-tetrahydrodipicolinate synthase [Shouchella clausii]MDO7283288.1 4-hydroxy-tetrahydrodipicolinate synthase [Shouchella clausii]MDO7288039.1 4-hydroxy-tetrahydrodipicolinate synthase [Shouchella clausii]MDO7303385.1 4-hydroxy-tetrahydrodipicolinate synthase [Shouchella clausii]PAE90831.1 4-hydroxy-tetrahydrodipicolinate synthase [Shouchella clausii]
MDFGYLMTAMVTPFTNENALDVNGIRTLIHHLANNGTDTVVIHGTTGEAPTLTLEEKQTLLSVAVEEAANANIKVIAGIGANSTQQAVQMAQLAEQTGADGLMVVVPYYNKPSQEGIYQHIAQVAQSTPLPVLLYNVPGRTGADMSAETALRLAEIDQVFAIKEASGNIDKVTEILRLAPEGFSVYSGDDSLTLPMMAVGAKGVVSVASHIVGREMKQMIDAFASGELQLAASIHHKLFPVMKAMFMAPSPAPVKEALARYRLPGGGVRLPLIGLNEAENMELTAVLEPFLPIASRSVASS